MPVNLVALNGTNRYIDYGELESSLTDFLGPKCTEATMYVLNNFPAPVSSECKIDLLILLSLNDINGNYTRYPNGNGNYDYFRNLVAPITINTQYRKSNIKLSGNFLEVDGYEHNNIDELNSLKFGLLNFLSNSCEMDRSKLFIQPIELILNDHTSVAFGNCIVDKSLLGQQFFKLIQTDPKQFFQACQLWKGSANYITFKNDVARINEAAGKFTEFGFLTRKKIERIAAQLTRDSAMYDSIGKQPTLISGKAGTGKTSHLLHLLIRCLVNNRNVSFLTYNQLLTKEITYQVKMTQRALANRLEAEGKDPSDFAFATVQTLMGFMFRLSRSLGVLHLMTEKRMIELKAVLEKSLESLEIHLPVLLQEKASMIFGITVNWKAAIETLQNSTLDVSSKQYGIAFIKFLKKHNKSLTQALKQSIDEFRINKLGQLEEMSHKRIFLQDYTGCLKSTLDLIRNSEQFYEQFEVKSKYDLLDVLMNLGERKQDEGLENHEISLNVFNKRVRNVLKARTGNDRIFMIDEGQDCHSYEREIFYEMFSPQRVVVSFGGKEQLIRFSEVCKWEMFKGREIAIRKIGSGNKSYRVKQSLLDFCNFIAEHYKIDLKLQSYSEEDHGELIFDFRPLNDQSLGVTFSKLLEKGAVNGCMPVESLMILDVNSPDNGSEDRIARKSDPVAVVNEYNVMEDSYAAEYKEFGYLRELANHAQYWVGAVADKQKIGFPAPNEVRVINYESCRGLEAWCVMCLNIDKFFTSQLESEDAEKYLLHEDMYLTIEQRSAMYAITWILMAATRSIDTLFLQMSNPENELVKLCMEYAKANPEKCSSYGGA